ncbi:MAG: hypothetical protein WA231_11900 [Methylocella sp.]
MTKAPLNVEFQARDRPDEEIEITPAMIEAGEAVLDAALEQAQLPPSWYVLSAVKDVYIAMDAARPVPKRKYSAQRVAMAAQDDDRRDGQ